MLEPTDAQSAAGEEAAGKRVEQAGGWANEKEGNGRGRKTGSGREWQGGAQAEAEFCKAWSQLSDDSDLFPGFRWESKRFVFPRRDVNIEQVTRIRLSLQPLN